MDAELILIDGSNVRRSGWPNATAAELVTAVAAWRSKRAPQALVIVVFDGSPTELDTDADPVRVVTVPYADAVLADIARDAVEEGSCVRAATSDRELRERLVAAGAVVAWGGGALFRELGLGRG